MANRIQLERDYWNENALDPDVDIKYISDVSTEECVDALEIPETAKTILDLGCGVGRITSAIANKDRIVWGTDISQNMLDIAKKISSQVVYVLGDGRTIPFHRETSYYYPELGPTNGPFRFDFIYSMLVFQHLEGPTISGYMEQAYKHLNPGGLFRFQFVEGTNSEGPFSNHYTYMQMSDWLREAGFVVDKVDRGLCHFQWCWVTARKAE